MSESSEGVGSAAKGDPEKVKALKDELTKLRKQNNRYAEKARKEDRGSLVTSAVIVGVLTILGLFSGGVLGAIFLAFGGFLIAQMIEKGRTKSPERMKYDLRESRIQEIEHMLQQAD
jgi:hypothetical protein